MLKIVNNKPNELEVVSLLEREAELQVLEKARKEKGIAYEELGKKLGFNAVYMASVFNGQQYVPPDQAEKIALELGVSKKNVEVLSNYPYKGNVDPVIYRLQEIVDVYGPSIKEVIHEKFGDGIMSAIDFSVEVQKEEDPGGDRVVITLNGKFLPYKVF